MSSKEDDCPIIPPTQVGHPTFYPDVLTKSADYGILKKLIGTWVNVDNTKGIHTTCLPSPGTTSEQIPGKFRFLSEDYTESLTFKEVPGGVRNRGGANEQIIGAVKYDQSIKSLKTGKGIHEENGMFLWLDNMYNHPADNASVEEDLGFPELMAGDGARASTAFVPKHKIARSGTIPHGNSIMLLGEPTTDIEGPPQFPSGLDAWDSSEHLAISPSMGGGSNSPINLDEAPPDWVHDNTLFDRDPSGNETYTQRILAHPLYPCSTRPDLRLRDTIKDQKIQKHDLIVLSTEFDNGQGPQGGVNSTPMVEKFTPVKKITFRMWIEDVVEDGKIISQLQYEQIMFFEFGFGTDGGTTLWPHIQVNTLRKKEDCGGNKYTP